jgi:hypothetical protein
MGVPAASAGESISLKHEEVKWKCIREGDNVGVERAVTRWYVLRQVLVEEIARLETKIASDPEQADVASGGEAVSVEALHEQLVRARERLRLLGPCPKPMMG